MTKRPRDQHKWALYEAEDVLQAGKGFGRQFLNISHAVQWVHTIQSVDELLEGLPWIGVKKAHGNAKASWAVFEDSSIVLTSHGLCEQIILHELAHLATGPGYSYHGREFCWNYLDLTLRWRGASVYIELRNAIRERGII